MDGKYIPVVIFSCFMILAVTISLVSSFSVDSLKYQTFVPTLLPNAGHTELESLSWDSSEDQEPEYNSSNSLSFSLKLHHVDNLMMSSHDHQGGKMTWESLFKKRLERDASRVLAITKSRSSTSGNLSSPVISGVPWDSNEYFTRIGVGSPPKYFYMVMDVLGGYIWLQCLPCEKCYKQIDSIFDPNTSSSFHRMPCKSLMCDIGSCNKHSKCQYELTYGNGSFSKGEFVTETLTFGKSTTEVPNVVIGCSHDNEGHEFLAAAGYIGLAAREDLSFVGQGGNKFGNMFSYCLPNRSSNKSSYLIFGDSLAASRKAVYTPLVNNRMRGDSLYYVGLEGISVGGLLVQGIDASTFRIDPRTGGGGVIIDSGTSVTRLTKYAYVALRDAFRNATYKHLKPAAASKYSISILDTCYDLCGMKEVKVPTVDLHFHGGAIVPLPQSNYMVPVDNKKMTYCFGFAGTTPDDGGMSIIGNILQQGIGMVFDLPNHRLGFALNAC